MRLWTVHPKYLDSKGLVAAWREALLAQKVLAGQTRGYRHHPQVLRFQSHRRPLEAIATFLAGLAEEARFRGYRFDTQKIGSRRCRGHITETRGQLLYEWDHLLAKLHERSPERYEQFHAIRLPLPHPLFVLVPGTVRVWEKP